MSELNQQQRLVDELEQSLLCRIWENPNFEKRLISDGLSNVLRELIASPVAAQMPPNDLETISHELSARLKDGIPNCPNQFARNSNDFVAMWEQEFEPAHPGDDRIPFAEVFDYWVEKAIKQITSAYSKLRPNVIDELRRSLARLLSGLAGQPLQMLFSMARLDNISYDEFVEHTIQTGMADVFDEYVELEPLLDLACATVAQSVAEFLIRLHDDTELLQAKFDLGLSIEQITSLQLGLSDRHSGGRTVIVVSIEGGGRLVYKPRCLGLECGYNRLLDWINKAGFEPAFQSLRVAEAKGYGWVEFASSAPCLDTESARLYFRRAGALAALWWVLDATDIHMANVFACGENPILVDVETFFQNADRSPSNTIRGIQQLAFFPRIEKGSNCQFDVSGIDGKGGQRTDRKVPAWDNVGTDAMHLRYETALLKSCSNMVKIGDQVIGPMSHAVALEQGYSSMMRFLKSHSTDLLDAAGPMENLFGQTRRKVQRGTRVYFSALSASLQLSSLRCRIGRRAAIEKALGTKPTDEEISAIMKLDIPRCAIAQHDAPRREVARRLAMIDEELIESHCKDIRSALLRVFLGA